MKIKTHKIILSVIVLGILVTGAFFLLGTNSSRSTVYQFVTLKKGNIETVISSSGTLSPVTKVEVGTQVSGTINKIFVDFNDKVKKGEVIAILDSSLLQVAVKEARSGLLKAEAQLEEAQASYNRSSLLSEKGLLSEADFQTVKTALKNGQAMMTSAQAASDRAEQNLRYAIIRSPINGTVTDRSIEEGQTVAASFATPTLFTIAQDLSKMEIKALVDESDIGQIKEGQDVRFSVQAYPENKFKGKVKQVRVQPATNANVVNYTVVVSADNKENLLLPGMTATVDFIIESKMDVLLVQNAALRYQPSENELAEAQKNMLKRFGQSPSDSSTKSMMRDKDAMPPPPSGEPPKAPSDMKQIWYLDNTGALVMEPVRIGITDGTNTEIVRYRSLAEGMNVVGGSGASNKSTNSKSSSNKMQGGPPGGMPPPM
jgi:HlyD family secretion protein